MGAMLVHVSALEYLSVLALRRFSEEDLRRIQKAEDFATEKLQGILRRDGTPAIEHSRALALKACELKLSANAIAIAWLHDVLEDNLNVTSWDLYCLFGVVHGAIITNGVIALTQCDWMSDEVYFNRIEVASSVNWEIVVVKLIDRWHFHSDFYNGPEKKELAKIDQTQKIFQQTIRNCEVLVPEDFRSTYNQLLDEVLELAEIRQAELMAA